MKKTTKQQKNKEKNLPSTQLTTSTKILLKIKNITLTEKTKQAITYTLVTMAFILSIYIRLQPALRFGPYLTGDDPVLHYRLTKYVVETGKLPEIDPLAWYPWGQHVTQAFPILHYYLGAYLYKLTHLILPNLDLYTFTVYEPAYFSSLAIPLTYLITKKIWNRTAAIFSTYFAALNGGYLTRTIAGFYRHEQFAIPFILLSLYFTITATQTKTLKKTILYSLLSALAIFTSAGLWKGYRYLPTIYALTTYLLILLEKANQKNLIALTLPTIGELIAIPIYPELTAHKLQIDHYLVISAFFAAAATPHFQKQKTRLKKSLPPIILGAIIVAATYTLLHPTLEGRLQLMLTPIRQPKLGDVRYTVAEHASGTYFLNYINFGVIYMVASIALLLWRRRNVNDYLIPLTVIISLYFSISLVRVAPLYAAFLAPITGIPLAYVINKLKQKWDTMWYIYRQTTKKKKAKKRKIKPNTKLITPTLLLTSLIILTLPYTGYQGYIMAHSYPLGLATYKGNQSEWFQALAWIKSNTTPTDIIGSWWDYGYWFETYCNRSTLADGATTNSSQIKLLARAFMSDEASAWRFFKRFNVSYVVVDAFQEMGIGSKHPFYGFGTGSNYKWTAMAAIFGVSAKDYVKFQQTQQTGYLFLPTSLALNTTIFKLCSYPEFGKQLGIELQYFELVYKSEPYPVYVYRVK